MIPRIAEGSWVVKQSVGTTPVIVGRKLKTSYHITPKYVEVAVDVGSSSTAQYVTGMVSAICLGGSALLRLAGLLHRRHIPAHKGWASGLCGDLCSNMSALSAAAPPVGGMP